VPWSEMNAVATSLRGHNVIFDVLLLECEIHQECIKSNWLLVLSPL
jgi:hypothetical protein